MNELSHTHRCNGALGMLPASVCKYVSRVTGEDRSHCAFRNSLFSFYRSGSVKHVACWALMQNVTPVVRTAGEAVCVSTLNTLPFFLRASRSGYVPHAMLSREGAIMFSNSLTFILGLLWGLADARPIPVSSMR